MGWSISSAKQKKKNKEARFIWLRIKNYGLWWSNLEQISNDTVLFLQSTNWNL